MLCKGRYNTATIYADDIESAAYAQIRTLLDQKWAEGSRIRIMPDVHAGAGCVIGFTMTVVDKVCPNLVGVDIGCGMHVVELGKVDFDFQKLDDVIRSRVPAGRSVHENGDLPDQLMRRTNVLLDKLKCRKALKEVDHIVLSMGTLGGGNHFIEVDEDLDGNRYLIVHSGSRSLGTQVASHYQKTAIASCGRCPDDELKVGIENIRKYCKEHHTTEEIPMHIECLKKELAPENVPDELAYVTGENLEDYLHDTAICQEYAMMNRKAMLSAILDGMFGKKLEDYPNFCTMHNYIGSDRILRKGSISLKEGERALIPINMAEGALIVTGKGNPEYNFSGPHGAGRRLSRSMAKEEITLEEFENSMAGIWSTSVSESTIDESPMAYKSLDDILPHLEATAYIVSQILPVYNFKA